VNIARSPFSALACKSKFVFDARRADWLWSTDKRIFQLRTWQYPLLAPDFIGLVIVGSAAKKVASSRLIAR
tara:strand:- start:749 stop:961 length:213 start_codon:yes stop_codon:yes gene_type:complete